MRDTASVGLRVCAAICLLGASASCGVLDNVRPDEPGLLLYDVVDLGAAVGYSLRATDLNDSGAVVGIHFPADVATGFLWRAGAVTNLDGCLVQSGVDPRINAMGQVLCEISETGGAITGFWQDGSVTPVPGADGSFRGVALNDSGDVAGGTRFLSGGQMTDIAEKPHMLIPLATELNNRRQVLMKGRDVSTYFSGAEGAYLWNASDGSTSAVMSNGRYGRFGRMNDSGVVAGTFHQQGVEFSGMSSFDINNAGDIVGSDSSRAFVAIGGTKHILDAVVDADADLVSALVINESGQILVQGNVRSSGKASWFLLTPRQTPALRERVIP